MSLKHGQRIGSWVGIFAVVGTVVSPAIVAAASANANTTINATLGSTISISTSSTVAIGVTPTSGGVLSNNSDTVTVNTNNALGYVLSLADNDATTTLLNGGNSIAASSGTKTTPIVLAANTWGYAVNNTTTGLGTNGFDTTYASETNNASSTSKWAGVPATGSPVMLKTTATTATNDTTTVWYAVNATTAKPNGVYSDTVTYTATTN